MRAVRLLLAFALSFAALALVVPAASAHPLGNFTINHYSGLRISPTAVLVDHVTDFAEIPTFSERRTMDTDANGQVSDSEAAAYAQTKCTALASDLDLEVGGSRLSLGLAQLGISFPMGQGNPTMRLVCVYNAAVAGGIGAATSVSFTDRTYAERQGWREITVVGDGTTLGETDPDFDVSIEPADALPGGPPGGSVGRCFGDVRGHAWRRSATAVLGTGCNAGRVGRIYSVGCDDFGLRRSSGERHGARQRRHRPVPGRRT